MASCSAGFNLIDSVIIDFLIVSDSKNTDGLYQCAATHATSKGSLLMYTFFFAFLFYLPPTSPFSSQLSSRNHCKMKCKPHTYDFVYQTEKSPGKESRADWRGCNIIETAILGWICDMFFNTFFFNCTYVRSQACARPLKNVNCCLASRLPPVCASLDRGAFSVICWCGGTFLCH